MNASALKGDRRILIIKLRYIGDTILTTPLIRALKTDPRIGGIDLLVPEESAVLLRDCPLIDNAIALPNEARRSLMFWPRFFQRLRSARYDVAIDLTGSDRSSLLCFMTGAPVRLGYAGPHCFRERFVYTRRIPSVLGCCHTVDHHLKMAEALGVSVETRHPCLPVSPAALTDVTRLLRDSDIGPETRFVVIHPGARRWYKSWPKDRFARLADHIMDAFETRVVLAGGPGDRDACRVIADGMRRTPVNLCGRVPLDRFAALARKAVCLIGNDSAPIHVATAVETPVLALFGPTPPDAWAPRRRRDCIISATFPCRPCGHSRQDCPLGDDYCMSTISYETVRDAVNGILRETPKAVLQN